MAEAKKSAASDAILVHNEDSFPLQRLATHISFMLLKPAWLDRLLARNARQACLVVFLRDASKYSSVSSSLFKLLPQSSTACVIGGGFVIE